jgi:hypothetical protein
VGVVEVLGRGPLHRAQNAVAAGSASEPVRGSSHAAGNAEVGELRAAAAEDDVGGLEVAVRDGMAQPFMEEEEPTSNVEGDGEGTVDRKGVAFRSTEAQKASQTTVLAEFHDNV